MPCIGHYKFENRVDVFGSNYLGKHNRGLALNCKRFMGAVEGTSEGRMDHSYALPVRDEGLALLPLVEINEHIRLFHDHMMRHNEGMDYFVSRLGCDKTGYSDRDMAYLFAQYEWPDNVHFPGKWQSIVSPETARHRIIVAGGRDFTNERLVFETLDKQLERFLNSEHPPVIVDGCAKGADRIGRHYAQARGLDWIEFPAPWDWLEKRIGNKKAAGIIRNAAMGQCGTALSAFWDGQSTGTKSMISLSESMGLQVKVTRYDQLELESSLKI